MRTSTPAPIPHWTRPGAAAALALALGGLVAALGLWAIARSLDESRTREAGALAAAVATLAAEGADRDLALRSGHFAAAAASLADDRLWNDPERLQRRLELLKTADAAYSWIGAADAAGRVLAATGGLERGRDVSRSEWFRKGSAGLHLGDLHETVPLNESLPPPPRAQPWRFIDVALPLRDAQQTLRGVLTAHLAWPRLRESLTRAAHTAGPDAQLWLLGSDNRPRLMPLESKARQPLVLDAVARARRGPAGWLVETWPDGQAYVTGYAALAGQPTSAFGDRDWVALLRLPAPAWSPAERRRFTAYVLASALAVLVLAALAWWAAAAQRRPLRAFSARLAQLREGRQPPALPARAPREFHELEQGIAHLVQGLEDREAQVQQSLEELRLALRAFGRGFPGVLASLRVEGEQLRFCYVGESAHRYLGLRPQEILNDAAAWDRHAEPGDARTLSQAVAELRRIPRGGLSHTARVRGGDGQVRRLHTLLIARDDPAGGRAQAFDCISLDISELDAQREQTEQALRAKSDFLSTMSHELRTPLNAILGFSRVLEDTLAPGQQQRQARFIRETGEMLTRILHDVLDLAKVESNSFALQPRPFVLNQVLEGCRAVYRVVAVEKGLDFQVEPPRGLPPLVGDPVRLRQVLEKLLSNAFKFTSTGAVALCVNVERLDAAAGDGGDAGQVLLRLRVTDSGIGMTPEQVRRSFERFEQADRSAANRYGGTGLGLSIVKAVVGRMGGEIDLVSHLGSGTEVVLLIPFGLAPAGEAGGALVDLAAGEPPLRVLVADDVAVNRLLIRAWLEMRGHQVIEAEDGVQAIARVREERPDLVLMDLDMPHIDGLEATRRLRAADGPERVTPIYALSGKAFPEDIAAVRSAGMDGHLPKPVTLEALVRVLRSVRSAPTA